MTLPIPPEITQGQIALDPVNGVVYYKDAEGNLVSTTWSWLRDDISSISTDDEVIIDSNLTVSGNLIIEGDTVTLNTSELLVEDNFIILNSNVTGSPILNAGIEIERGTSPNIFIRWNESVDQWQYTNDGTTYLNLSSIIENSVELGLHTTGNYVKNLAAGTGVTISNPSGEGTTPNISIDTSIVQTRVADISDTEIGYLNGVTSAIQTQIDSKAPTSGPTFTGTTTLPSTTSIGNVSNTEIGYLDGVTSGIQTQIDSKASIASPTFTGTVNGITKTMVGLGSVDNTADTAKPVSTPQQTALNLKANSATPTFTGMTTVAKITVGGIEIDTTSPADTNVLKYDAGLNKYVPGVASTVASLDDLTDVIISEATPNQVLKYNGENWVNATDNEGTSINSLDDIGDVVITSETPNQVLKYDGTNWVNLNTSYSLTIGDGINISFVLTHNLNTRDIILQARNANSPYGAINIAWEATTVDSATVYFDSPPDLNSITIKIVS